VAKHVQVFSPFDRRWNHWGGSSTSRNLARRGASLVLVTLSCGSIGKFYLWRTSRFIYEDGQSPTPYASPTVEIRTIRHTLSTFLVCRQNRNGMQLVSRNTDVKFPFDEWNNRCFVHCQSDKIPHQQQNKCMMPTLDPSSIRVDQLKAPHLSNSKKKTSLIKLQLNSVKGHGRVSSFQASRRLWHWAIKTREAGSRRSAWYDRMLWRWAYFWHFVDQDNIARTMPWVCCYRNPGIINTRRPSLHLAALSLFKGLSEIF